MMPERDATVPPAAAFRGVASLVNAAIQRWPRALDETLYLTLSPLGGGLLYYIPNKGVIYAG